MYLNRRVFVMLLTVPSSPSVAVLLCLCVDGFTHVAFVLLFFAPHLSFFNLQGSNQTVQNTG